MLKVALLSLRRTIITMASALGTWTLLLIVSAFRARGGIRELIRVSLAELVKHVATGALHNSAERSAIPKCHPGTRVVVQKEMLSWIRQGLHGDVPKKIMWVTGPAGSGKTTIMDSIADTCQKEGILGATHFFSSLLPRNRCLKRHLVATLAYQLVQHPAMLQVEEHILAAVGHDPLVFGKKLEEQLEKLILAPVREYLHPPPPTPELRDHPPLERRDRPPPPEWPKVILIDGLDECEAEEEGHSKASEEDQKEVLSVLKKAVEDPDFPFRIVIASRPEHVIKDFFADVASSITEQLFLGERFKPDNDLKLTLESTFTNIRRQRGLPDSWPGDTVPSTIVGNSSGQFIYISTVALFLESPGDPRLLLKQVLQLPGITAPTSPFARLDELYTHILKRSQDTESDSDIPLSRRRILWLNLLFREKCLFLPTSNRGPPEEPLAATFRLFVESYPGEASDVFRSLNSLVSVPSAEASNRSRYTLYHHSMVDFLADPARSGNLYIAPEVVSEFFLKRYLQHWESRCCFMPFVDLAHFECSRQRSSEFPHLGRGGHILQTLLW
jgi:hypothetical protein